MAKRREVSIESFEDLAAYDEELDFEVCGIPLKDPGEGRFAFRGAHDPTPTPYFILEELFEYFDFASSSHLLDVGCGMGRALAYFERSGFEGRASGIELDPDLAAVAQKWSAQYKNLSVTCGDALELPLAPYTDYYLFNPFDTNLLFQFVGRIEAECRGPITLVHMSDNGETYYFIGRDGWSKLGSGWYDYYHNDRGRKIEVYDYAQHYTAWRFDPNDV